MNKREMLVATISAYIILAQNLDSVYYWKRVRETMKLLHGNLM
jgi:hypothetical protein